MYKRLISHRGNINGKNEKFENNPGYVREAFSEGYDIEVDLWYINDAFYLGHDSPQYLLEGYDILYDNKYWKHAKNYHALEKIIEHRWNGFWHNTDAFTFTTLGWLWAYPGVSISTDIQKSVAVMPDGTGLDISNFGGICSDFIGKYRINER